MQGKWKLWPHSAVKMVVPPPVFTPCKHIPHLLFARRRLDLSNEKVDGERGEEGADLLKNLGLFPVLQWSFTLCGADELVGTATVCVPSGGMTVVLQRRLGPETG